MPTPAVTVSARATWLTMFPVSSAERRPLRFSARPEVLADEQLHDQVGEAAVHAVVVDLDDVRAAEHGRCLGLALEARARRLHGEHVGADELDGENPCRA